MEKIVKLSDVVGEIERLIAKRTEFKNYYEKRSLELGIDHPLYRQYCNNADQEFSKILVLRDLIKDMAFIETLPAHGHEIIA